MWFELNSSSANPVSWPTERDKVDPVFRPARRFEEEPVAAAGSRHLAVGRRGRSWKNLEIRGRLEGRHGSEHRRCVGLERKASERFDGHSRRHEGRTVAEDPVGDQCSHDLSGPQHPATSIRLSTSAATRQAVYGSVCACGPQRRPARDRRFTAQGHDRDDSVVIAAQ